MSYCCGINITRLYLFSLLHATEGWSSQPRGWFSNYTVSPCWRRLCLRGWYLRTSTRKEAYHDAFVSLQWSCSPKFDGMVVDCKMILFEQYQHYPRRPALSKWVYCEKYCTLVFSIQMSTQGLYFCPAKHLLFPPTTKFYVGSWPCRWIHCMLKANIGRCRAPCLLFHDAWRGWLPFLAGMYTAGCRSTAVSILARG